MFYPESQRILKQRRRSSIASRTFILPFRFAKYAQNGNSLIRAGD